RIDLFDLEEKILYDWKETSVWKFMLGDTIEWEEQSNINACIMRMNSIEVKELCNIAILKDWKARKARMTRRDDYPQCAIHIKKLPLWSIGVAQDFILKRIEAHTVPLDEELPLCSNRERWQRDTQYAVMQKGKKRAIRVFPHLPQAEALLKFREGSAQPGQKFVIEERPTEPVRCLDFCPVQQFCDFGREAVKKWRQATE